MADRRSSSKRNPDGLDLGTALGVALLAGLGYFGYNKGWFEELFKSDAPKIVPKPTTGTGTQPAPPTTGGSTGTGGGTSSTGKRAMWMSFEVAPPNPAIVINQNPRATVVYQGRLTTADGQPMPGGYIEIWDADANQPFMSTQTDADGWYSLRHELTPDWFGGYRVFALYPGNNQFEAYKSGDWAVVPQ